LGSWTTGERQGPAFIGREQGEGCHCGRGPELLSLYVNARGSGPELNRRPALDPIGNLPPTGRRYDTGKNARARRGVMWPAQLKLAPVSRPHHHHQSAKLLSPAGITKTKPGRVVATEQRRSCRVSPFSLDLTQRTKPATQLRSRARPRPVLFFSHSPPLAFRRSNQWPRVLASSHFTITIYAEDRYGKASSGSSSNRLRTEDSLLEKRSEQPRVLAK
jgi:hypothetical protein